MRGKKWMAGWSLFSWVCFCFMANWLIFLPWSCSHLREPVEYLDQHSHPKREQIESQYELKFGCLVQIHYISIAMRWINCWNANASGKNDLEAETFCTPKLSSTKLGIMNNALKLFLKHGCLFLKSRRKLQRCVGIALYDILGWSVGLRTVDIKIW